LCGIFFIGSLGPLNHPMLPQILEAFRFALGFWKVVLILSGFSSLMLWSAIHTQMHWQGWGWTGQFADERHDYDWWGRRIKTPLEPKELR
jgi:hypothetical protein